MPIIHGMLMIPRANSEAMSAQQQPTHHAPCTTPIRSAPSVPSRQLCSTKSNGADEFLGASSVPGSGPGGMFEHVTPRTSMVGTTIWDKLAADVEVQQSRIAAAERTLTPTVIAAATACRGDGASPAPSAAP